MRIAINGQQLTTAQFAGPEIYTLNIVKALGELDLTNEYTIFLDKTPSEEVMEALLDLPDNFKIKIIPKILSWTQISLAFALYKGNFDVLFSALHTIPILALPKVKMVSMIHGLEFRTNQEKLKFPKNLFAGKLEWMVCRFSHKIVVPSMATKQAILNTKWKLRNPDIAVIPEGVSEKFVKRSTKEVAEVLEKYHIPNEPYLIFISTIQPRKNLKSIVEALSILKNKYSKNINLVACGKKGWNFEEEINSPQKFGVENQVLFVGRIPDEELINLLSGAKAYISASFDEGFGLPLLEAMSCEIPAIVSDISAYKDLAENQTVYINPNSVEDIANKINSFWEEDPSTTENQVREAKTRAGEYSWEKSAQKLINTFSQFNE
jgi:glycosyltransferase involved in cell wall biosynthesis